MNSTWYLIQTKPNAHNMAARNLARQGCDVFLPLAEQTRRTAQQFRTELRPLFPGYLFVGLQAQAIQPGAHSIPRMGSLAVSALMEPIAQSQRRSSLNYRTNVMKRACFGRRIATHLVTLWKFRQALLPPSWQRWWIWLQINVSGSLSTFWGKNRALRWIHKISDVRDESNKTSRHRHCLASVFR